MFNQKVMNLVLQVTLVRNIERDIILLRDWVYQGRFDSGVCHEVLVLSDRLVGVYVKDIGPVIVAKNDIISS